MSLGDDDLGETGVESNLVAIQGGIDPATGEAVPEESLLLPADAWRDASMLDWIFGCLADCMVCVFAEQVSYTDRKRTRPWRW